MHIDQVLVQSLSIHQFLNSNFQFEVDLDHLNIRQWLRPRRFARLQNVHLWEVSVNLPWSRTVINFRYQHHCHLEWGDIKIQNEIEWKISDQFLIGTTIHQIVR